MIMVLGEITTNARIDYQRVIRNCIRRIGYNGADIGERPLRMATIIANTHSS